MYICMCIYMHMGAYMNIHIYLCKWIHTHACSSHEDMHVFSYMYRYTYIYTYIYVHKPSAHAWNRKPHMITLHALHSISAPQRTISAVLAAAGYACSSAVTTSGPARHAAAQCSGSFLDLKKRQRATSARHTGRQVGRHASSSDRRSMCMNVALHYHRNECRCSCVYMCIYTYTHTQTHKHIYTCSYIHM